jgi:aminoglycoside phosphotransferase (APT) family kinase protein
MMEGVDLAALEQWMDGQGVGEGPIADARLLSGGTQNILMRFRRRDDAFVLRRPPPVRRSTAPQCRTHGSSRRAATRMFWGSPFI